MLPGLEVARVTADTRRWTGYSTQYGLTLVTAGAFDFWYRRRSARQTPGTVKLKEPGEVHRDLRVLGPVSATSFGLSPALVAAAAAGLERPVPPHFADLVAGAGTPLAAIVRRLDRALADPDAARDPLRAESLLAAALATALTDHAETAGPPPPPLAIGRARDYLVAHLAERVRLDALAAAVGLDKFQLVRAFARTLGLPPYAYLTHLRVARARQELAAGVAPAEVAAAVGFCDQSQLHRHFVRITGTTPARYRRARTA